MLRDYCCDIFLLFSAAASFKRKKGRDSSNESATHLARSVKLCPVTPSSTEMSQSVPSTPKTSADVDTYQTNKSNYVTETIDRITEVSHPAASTSGSSLHGDVIPNPFLPCIDIYHKNDIGNHIGRVSLLSHEEKRDILSKTWVPPETYDFKLDARHLKRKFNHVWLRQYTPWLAYSQKLKGPLCKYCVLFPPPSSTIKGTLGSLMVRPFLKYKDIHEYCKSHMNSHYHKTAAAASKTLLETVPVDIQLQNSYQNTIAENREIIESIISVIIFCGTHDLALRGKELADGVFIDLLNLRIESGDSKLKDHLEKSKKMQPIFHPEFRMS